MKEMMAIILSAVLVNNFVLVKFLGVCPFLGVSKKMDSAMGMSFAVIFVMVLATAVTYPIYYGLLARFEITYLQTIIFILVMAFLVQLIEIAMKKYLPSLYRSLGIYLPLITSNCAILGVCILNIDSAYTYGQSLLHSFGAGVGFMLALGLFAGIRGHIENSDFPEAFKGTPAVLISASIVSLSFIGFSGIIEGLFGA
ncbi:MAG: electron transport complex protein RnfA [Bacillota bacterium]|jgi:electron transport complex protein RnfA